jgi:hypothetical protein
VSIAHSSGWLAKPGAGFILGLFKMESPVLIGRFMDNLLYDDNREKAITSLLSAMYDLDSEHMFVKTLDYTTKGGGSRDNIVVVLSFVDAAKVKAMKQDLLAAMDCEGFQCFNDVAVVPMDFNESTDEELVDAMHKVLNNLVDQVKEGSDE